MDKFKLTKVLNELNIIKSKMELLTKDANEVRFYYKHTSDDLDSASESFIISFENGDIEGAIDHLKDIMDIMYDET